MINNNDNNLINNQNPKYIESLSEECTDLRLKYDNCFNDWFKNVFLTDKNNNSSNENKICDFEFVKYQKCLFKSIEDLDQKANQASDGNNKQSVPGNGLMDSIKEAENEILGFENK
ncbi:hypothetical protein QEN19_002774 [Hanseniaspora menglaensis]